MNIKYLISAFYGLVFGLMMNDNPSPNEEIDDISYNNFRLNYT